MRTSTDILITPSDIGRSRRKIVNLQALRAIAASLVVVDHSIQILVARHMLPESKEQLGWFLGWLGVSAFFVISGLIMLRSSIDKFGTASSAMKFLHRRVVRVVPMYWLATCVYLALKTAQGTHFRWMNIVKSFFFIPYAVDSPGHIVVMRPIVGQGWTLNYEMFFYLLFTGCLLLPKKIGGFLVIAIFPIAVLACIAFRPLIPYSDPVDVWHFWSDPITIFFSAGLLIALMEYKRKVRFTFHTPLVGAVSLFAFGIFLFLIADIRFPLPVWDQAAFGLLAIGAVLLCTEPNRDRIIQQERLLETAGDASFSTYLFHPLVIAVLGAIWGRLPSYPAAAEMFIVIALIACNLTGVLIYFSVEKPLLSLLSQKPQPSPITVAAEIPFRT